MVHVKLSTANAKASNELISRVGVSLKRAQLTELLQCKLSTKTYT